MAANRIRKTHLLITVAILLLVTGCQSGPWARQQEPVDPALPMTMSRNELVDYLNRQSGNLSCWKSSQVKMKVRMPRMVPVTLNGSMACESPNRFHLRASNTLVHADLGSNTERCWVYIKPGADGVVSWRHEDAHLLEQLPTGVPYIDPDWLMEVLGVTPLEAERFVLGDPRSRRELWLAAVERSPSGRVLRRVIKVDTIRGVICEHTIYDDDDRVVVRAELSDHEPFDRHLIPRRVLLTFPGMDAEMTLTFSKIETNPQIASSLWQVPSVPGANNIDVGELVAGMQEQQGQHNDLRSPYSQSSQQNEQRTVSLLPEPDWDTPQTEPDWDSARPKNRGKPVQSASFEAGAKRKRGWLRRWW